MRLDWTMDVFVPPALLSLLQIAADQAAIAEGLTKPSGAAVRFCDDATIRKLNAAHRGMDKSTDVLSFPSISWSGGLTAGHAPEKLGRVWDPELRVCFLGDVVISLDHLKVQAEEFGHSESREAAYLLVHALCHLMGYDHIKEEDRILMREKEEEILSAIGITRNTPGSVSDATLLGLAREAMTRSYSPYSDYPVGAALHATDGRIFQGCNIENASFGATICAERTAMVKAVSEGATEFDVIAIATRDTPGWPCGICRQFMSEFAPDLRVLVTWGDGQHVEESTLGQILPHQFDLKGKKS